MRDVALEIILKDKLMVSVHVIISHHHFHVHFVIIVTEYLIVEVAHPSFTFIFTSLLINNYRWFLLRRSNLRSPNIALLLLKVSPRAGGDSSKRSEAMRTGFYCFLEFILNQQLFWLSLTWWTDRAQAILLVVMLCCWNRSYNVILNVVLFNNRVVVLFL